MQPAELDFCVTLALVFAIITGLFLLRRLPSADSIQTLITMLNTKGGNILILSVMAMVFFRSFMHLVYVVLQQIQAQTLREDNAIALMGLQFVSTTAFGGALGALLKTMTGEAPQPPANSVNVTNSLVSSGNGE